MKYWQSKHVPELNGWIENPGKKNALLHLNLHAQHWLARHNVEKIYAQKA